MDLLASICRKVLEEEGGLNMLLGSLHIKYPGDGNFRSVSWALGCVLPSSVL